MKELLTRLRKQQEGVVTIFTLPEELLVSIFSFLGTAEGLCTVSIVCKVFNLVSSDDILWKPLCGPAWDIPPGYVPFLVSCFFPQRHYANTFSRKCKARYIEWLRSAVNVYTTRAAPLRHTPQDLGMTPDYDFLLKFLLLGDCGVGKSSILLRYIEDTFSENGIATVGVDFKLKTIVVNNSIVKVCNLSFFFFFFFFFFDHH